MVLPGPGDRGARPPAGARRSRPPALAGRPRHGREPAGSRARPGPWSASSRPSGCRTSPAACGWKHFFRGARTPVSNPASALLTQSKRFPLVWDRLGTPPAHLARAPAGDPRPARGGLAEGRRLGAQAGPRPRRGRHRPRRRHPRGGVAAHPPGRAPLPRLVGGAAAVRGRAAPGGRRGAVYPCVGVYTVDGRAAGAYGRVARQPLIDHLAQDAAVLLGRGRRSPMDALAAL